MSASGVDVPSVDPGDPDNSPPPRYESSDWLASNEFRAASTRYDLISSGGWGAGWSAPRTAAVVIASRQQTGAILRDRSRIISILRYLSAKGFLHPGERFDRQYVGPRDAPAGRFRAGFNDAFAWRRWCVRVDWITKRRP